MEHVLKMKKIWLVIMVSIFLVGYAVGVSFSNVDVTLDKGNKEALNTTLIDYYDVDLGGGLFERCIHKAGTIPRSCNVFNSTTDANTWTADKLNYYARKIIEHNAGKVVLREGNITIR